MLLGKSGNMSVEIEMIFPLFAFSGNMETKIKLIFPLLVFSGNLKRLKIKKDANHRVF